MALVDGLGLDACKLGAAPNEIHFHLNLELLHSVYGILESLLGEHPKVTNLLAHHSFLSNGLPLR